MRETINAQKSGNPRGPFPQPAEAFHTQVTLCARRGPPLHPCQRMEAIPGVRQPQRGETVPAFMTYSFGSEIIYVFLSQWDHIVTTGPHWVDGALPFPPRHPQDGSWDLLNTQLMGGCLDGWVLAGFLEAANCSISIRSVTITHRRLSGL